MASPPGTIDLSVNRWVVTIEASMAGQQPQSLDQAGGWALGLLHVLDVRLLLILCVVGLKEQRDKAHRVKGSAPLCDA